MCGAAVTVHSAIMVTTVRVQFHFPCITPDFWTRRYPQMSFVITVGAVAAAGLLFTLETDIPLPSSPVFGLTRRICVTATPSAHAGMSMAATHVDSSRVTPPAGSGPLRFGILIE